MTHTDIAEMIQVLRDLIKDGFTAAALAGLETLQRDVEALATQPEQANGGEPMTPEQRGIAAEYWGSLAQQKADLDTRRGVSMPVSYYASDVVAAALAHYATPAPAASVSVSDERESFPPMPEGWPARFRCDSCDGSGEVGDLVRMGDFDPPERHSCPDCAGRGWASEERAFNADHMREYASSHARAILALRPAQAGVLEVNRYAVIDAGFAELEKRGFKLNHSDIGTEDLWGVFVAMNAATRLHRRK